MKALTILEAGKVLKLDLDSTSTLGIMSRFKNGRSVVLINNEETACVMYDHAGPHAVWSAHILSSELMRGKKLWKFATETVAWMADQRKMKGLLMFVPEDNRKLSIALSIHGLKKVGTVYDQLIFVMDEKMILSFDNGGG